ncbi:hypothetical protein [Streptomyces sp. NBC_01190]|uniref:hypothetical protein n=1 Tax=Streptomyces sp. NBC_01190 TaxID=2903767 RepID=UPI003865B401|nr:hypothetical protein OG519_24555 [Streptomyces sp. NBC_01190]
MASNYQQQALMEESIQKVSQEGGTMSMALVSYSRADASKVLPDLEAGLRACSAYKSAGDPDISFEKPEVLPAPKLGDDAIAYRITQVVTDNGTDPVRAPFAYTVVRKGSVISWFQAMAFPGQEASIPIEVVKAQVSKLP